MKNQRTRIILLLLFLAAVVAARFTPLRSVLTFENLKQHRDSLQLFVQGNYWLSVAAYVSLYAITTSLSLPVALILTLAGGFLFGTTAAVLYIDVGATIGATIAFLSARYLLGERLQERYQDQLQRFNAEFERDHVHYLLTVRLIPIFPFFVINFLAGLTRVPLRMFIWTTAVGIIPATAVFAFAGRQIGSIDALGDIVTMKMLLAFTALGLMTLAPVLYKRVIAKGGRER